MNFKKLKANFFLSQICNYCKRQTFNMPYAL